MAKKRPRLIDIQAQLNETESASETLTGEFIPLEADAERLESLEQVIEKHLHAFYEVGCALREIKEEKLYRVLGYSRFEDYCIDRWDIRKSHAQRLESASIVIDNLKTSPNWGNFLPVSESHVRPLTILSLEEQRQAWAKVIDLAPVFQDKPKITAKLVQKVVTEIKGDHSSDDEIAIGRTRISIQISEDFDDSLNEAFYRIRKAIDTESKKKLSKALILEIALRKALAELESEGHDSVFLNDVLSAIKEE